MIHAYDRIYLLQAKQNMGLMLDYAVNVIGIELVRFYDMFLNSVYSSRFERGDCSTIAGKSGVELCYDVLDTHNVKYERAEQPVSLDKSEEYWTGWALADYQWYSGSSFFIINNEIPIEEIKRMYFPYHEMDITQFYDEMARRRQARRCISYLKFFRNKAGITQKELSDKTGIPIKTIQQYEQRQKNINSANAEYIIKLSKALYCRPENLMEID